MNTPTKAFIAGVVGLGALLWLIRGKAPWTLSLRGIFSLQTAPSVRTPFTHYRLRPLTITLPNGTVKPASAIITFAGTVQNQGSTPVFAAVLLRPLVGGVPIPDATDPSGMRQAQSAAVQVTPMTTGNLAVPVTVLATDPVGPITASAELWSGPTPTTLVKTSMAVASGALGTVDAPVQQINLTFTAPGFTLS